MLKRQWQVLKDGRPGQRFVDRYEEAKSARENASWAERARRVLRLMLAMVLIAIGVPLMVMPGPAILFFFLAGGLLASESRLIARVLDWLEVKLRAGWDRCMRHWRALPAWGKVICGAMVAVVSVGSAYASYRLVAG